MLTLPGAGVILLAAGIWAFVRTYRVWRDHGVWWAWQGAGLVLVTLTLLALTMGPHWWSPAAVAARAFAKQLLWKKPASGLARSALRKPDQFDVRSSIAACILSNTAVSQACS